MQQGLIVCSNVFFQLVDMRECERTWLAEHMGHELSMHKSHYVLQEPVIEMAKISRLLIAIEAGDATKFVGKALSDIQPEGDDTIMF